MGFLFLILFFPGTISFVNPFFSHVVKKYVYFKVQFAVCLLFSLLRACEPPEYRFTND